MVKEAKDRLRTLATFKTVGQHDQDDGYAERLALFTSQYPPVADSTAGRASGPRMIMFKNTLREALHIVEKTLGLPHDSKVLDLIDYAKESENTDGIAQACLRQNASFVRKYAVLLTDEPPPSITRTLALEPQSECILQRLVLQQLLRRMLFYSPTTRPAIEYQDFNSIGEVFESTFVSAEDLSFIENLIDRDAFGNGLVWWKAAVQEALHIASGTSPQYPTFDVLGGWIYSDAAKVQLDADGWIILANILGNPPNLESKFTPLCQTFEEMHVFFSVLHLALPPPPHVHDLATGRTRASMCQAGFIMAELVPSHAGELPPVVPTDKPGAKRGTIQWIELQRRAYLNGLIPSSDTAWTRSFFEALRAQERACVVVVYDETKAQGAPDAVSVLVHAFPHFRWSSFLRLRQPA
ncbi:hypothetical protein EXIGLDRAFT_691206 [Exidia glandulosa HHB12029]|uniref:Uncharacterized protein n=1 Tax=Exidia glandulosa HHB12029 TaxID=1314781 RepID=A0A166MVI9_EXIGL|nr:hypothetical protein EXIGLDRAFT_691206 [Exidia glandulosa HHB12029]